MQNCRSGDRRRQNNCWFQGRAELGPRALGNRSILCDPQREDMKNVLNARVKFREPFRPLRHPSRKKHARRILSPTVLRHPS